jgi:ELWxxDGT repeat protein
MCQKLRRTQFLSLAVIVATVTCGSLLIRCTLASQGEGNAKPGESPIRIEPVTDIWPGKGGSAPGRPVIFRGEAYFRAHNRDDGSDIWRFDGKRVEIAIEGNRPAFDYSVRVETVFNDRLYYTRPALQERGFARGGGEALELWEYDGTTSRQVKGVLLPAGGHLHFAEYRGELYFRGIDPVHGMELWKYDGKAPSLVQDLKPGPEHSEPEFMTVFQDALYFFAWHQDAGCEFWRYDGTEAELVADIDPRHDEEGRPRSSRFRHDYGGIVYRNKLVFGAGTATTGYEPVAWDGKRLTLLADIHPGPESSWCGAFCVYKDELYFRASHGPSEDEVSHCRELWKYDGEKATLVADGIGETKWRFVSVVGTWDDYLMLIADDGIHGVEPWYFDGRNVRMIADICPGPTDFRGGFSKVLGRDGIGVGSFEDRGLELFRLVKRGPD